MISLESDRVSSLNNMSIEQVLLQVKAAQMCQFHNLFDYGLTMEAIIDRTVQGELTENAIRLLKQDPQRSVTGHVILSVGDTRLLTKRRFYECNEQEKMVYRDDKQEKWRVVEVRD